MAAVEGLLGIKVLCRTALRDCESCMRAGRSSLLANKHNMLNADAPQLIGTL